MVWTVEGFEPLAELGRGSTGVVLQARDTVTGTVVAVRRLALDLCDSPAFLVRYRGEIAMLGLVEHPQLAGVYQLLENGGGVALITEFVDGVSLRALLDQAGPLDTEAALYVAKGVLLGLREVHARGIVHRALRPENVLIDSTGTVKVVDVGLNPPSRNRVPANPTYAAPELWSGAEPTPASDVYAATAVLFECLGGHPPRSMGGAYAGGSAQTADAAIAALNPTLVPDPLRGFLRLGLAPDPSSRPADAAAALAQSDVAAFASFGSRWYDLGHTLVQQRLSRAMPRTGSGNGATASRTAPAAPDGATISPVYLAGPEEETEPVAAPAAALAVREPAAESAPAPAAVLVREATPATWGDVAAPAAVEAEQPDAVLIKPRRSRRHRVLLAAAVLLLMAAGTGIALRSAFGLGGGGQQPVITNSHVPVAVPGPTVPPSTPGSGDTAKPTSPVNLRVTGRSVSAVSLDWADAQDDVAVAGYVVLRDGTQVGTTYQPGFTDTRLTSRTRYQYAVSAFDAAGNVSPPSAPVVANTLAEPDVSPPSVPQHLTSTSQSMTRIVLAWDASHDNIGVAGYEVYRDQKLIANVPRPGYIDKGLKAATKYRYTVRAYDTSNNASADSNVVAPTTLAAPDTTPPTAPTGVSALGTSPTTIDVSWTASSDNVGVALYRVFRNGVMVAEVAGTAHTDQGLAPSTTYSYSVRAVDAEDNESGSSAAVSGSTLDPPPTTTPPPPPTTTPPPTVDPPIVASVTLNTSITDCIVSISATVVVSAAMDVTLTYTITGGGSDSIPLQFVDGEPSQTVTLPNGDGLVTGSAHVSADGESATYDWSACEPPPPTTDPPPDEGGGG
jgi:chitodextrinase